MVNEMPDVVEVIDAAATIENFIDQIIIEFYKPSPSRSISFQWILLDSSVISLGAKVKVALAIAHEVNFEINIQHVQEVIRFRNAFAHHSTTAHSVFEIHPEPEKYSQYQELHLINASGQLKKIKRADALNTFRSAYSKAKVSLVELMNFLKKN